MAADLHIHVCDTPEQEKHAALYLKKSFWSSEIGPGYMEMNLNGEWIHEDKFYEQPEPVQGEFWSAVEAYDEKMDPEKKGERPPHVGVFTREIALKELDENIVFQTKNIWVGEVSWLKAALFEDAGTFVPRPILVINEATRDMPVIDDDLIDTVKQAFELDNTTGYKLCSADEVVKFLTEHKGKRCFNISW